MMHWGTNYGMGYGFGWIFMVLFWVLVILATVYLVKALLRGGSSENQISESPRELLEKRFARGEISKEEFEDALSILKKNKE